MFLSFLLLFWWSIEFPQQNINQSETGIGDKKLSEELYEKDKTEITANLHLNLYES